MPNRLTLEASPYLRRHAEQAIDWQPWSEAAFAQAANENKPILVSIGYLACFWCHVMAEESFSDPRVAERLGLDFVSIKVDREERPDVDRSVLDQLARLGARTGWPVTAFMTPQGQVYAGGSYYPPEPRHGLPGFLDVLDDARTRFARHDPSDAAVPPAGPVGQSVATSSRSAVADIEIYAGFLGDRLLENVDRIYGGFGQVGPRFPQISAHELLWRRHMSAGSRAFGTAATESMTRICRSALHDHVGGGFHRYCVDDAWTIPHFEKMLYDNAQLVELLTWLWRGTGASLFKDRIEGTIAWAIREMLIDGSGFASSIGAHSLDGVNESEDSGSFYRWTSAQLREALGPEASLFELLYEIAPVGEGASGALLQTEKQARTDDAARSAAALDLLRQRRETRPRPERDEKVMADWNGLMIVALIEAGSAFDRRDWLALAAKVFDQLVEQLADGAALRHCITQGTKGPEALLEDYAAMSRAALRLHEAFGKSRYLDLAVGWVALLADAFWDREEGGYFMSAASDWQPTARTRTITETSLPSGNGMMIGVLARLHELTGDGQYSDCAERLVGGFHADIVRHGIAATTAVNNVTTLARFVRITVAGRPELPETRDMLKVALDCALPDRMVLGPGAGTDAPSTGASAQVCVGTACLLPLTSSSNLRQLLAPGGLRAAEGAGREAAQ